MDPIGGGTGDNLALDAGADGSSKGNGSSYRNVNDGNVTSFWQPGSASGQRISVKRMAPFNTVVIRELNGATRSWQLVNHDTGEVLASGSRLGSETVVSGLETQDIYKVTLEILAASAPPQIAEIELYLGLPSADNGDDDTPGEQQPPVQPEVPLVLQESATGFCNVDGIVESEHAGFTGSGYANTDNLYGAGIDWAVNAGQGGDSGLVIRFANGASDRPASLYVNGQWVAEVNLPGTGEWTDYEESGSVSAYLNADVNRISLRATNNAGLPNVDQILVSGGNLSAVPCQ